MNDAGADQVVILAAGLGSRLMPITAEIPKALVPVAGVPIIQRSLATLARCGLKRAIIVVGYRAEQIRESLAKWSPLEEVHFIETDCYRSKNNSTSLWAAREFLTCNTLIMDGDTILSDTIIKRTQAEPAHCVIPVDHIPDNSTSGAVVRLADDFAVEHFQVIAKGGLSELSHGNWWKTLSIYKLSASFCQEHLVSSLRECASAQSGEAFYEEYIARSLTASRMRARGVICSRSRWIEIDTPADLAAAEQMFAESKIW
ncbi:NTP transferase domain-containing protein [Rhizobium jaguaris]|uniref:Phosphocholine cytidylyltransferase family protein n=1 Tax=Rhizobium jaguaris TaxID=1312183 RepID=A0A387GAK4_9HYPH|nr:phosphocholine cytidylyltransferase family protein [Rhizobium jaguaris]AYG64376.1 phosphocholine cytidylyltransferase family protein [Rhizobium jaguaris]